MFICIVSEGSDAEDRGQAGDYHLTFYLSELIIVKRWAGNFSDPILLLSLIRLLAYDTPHALAPIPKIVQVHTHQPPHPEVLARACTCRCAAWSCAAAAPGAGCTCRFCSARRDLWPARGKPDGTERQEEGDDRRTDLYHASRWQIGLIWDWRIIWGIFI